MVDKNFADMMESRRKALEEAFFSEQNAQAIEKIRESARQAERRTALTNASGITDVGLLDKLLELNISAETLAALSLVPLVEVAWADGKMEEDEKDAIRKAAKDNGLESSQMVGQILENWLRQRPSDQLMPVWVDYTRQLVKTINSDEQQSLRRATLERATKVATAAGGLLGVGAISKKEQDVLNSLQEAWS